MIGFNFGMIVGMASCIVLTCAFLPAKIKECENAGNGSCVVRFDLSRLPNSPFTYEVQQD